jgi:hypothetical protein
LSFSWTEANFPENDPNGPPIASHAITPIRGQIQRRLLATAVILSHPIPQPFAA